MLSGWLSAGTRFRKNTAQQESEELLNRRHNCSLLTGGNSTLKKRIARTQSERKVRDVIHAPAYTSHEDLFRDIDLKKLNAVLIFMHINDIDPYNSQSVYSAPHHGYSTLSLNRPDRLRRSRSEFALARENEYEFCDPPKGLRRTKQVEEFYSARDIRVRAKVKNKGQSKKNDVEYGPGIVERLRAKFNKLSGQAMKDARVAPHATCKRYPSVDDILSSKYDNQNTPPTRGYETLDRSWGGGSSHSSNSLSSLPKEHSVSIGDVTDRNEQKRRFVIHREVKYRDLEVDAHLPDINSLRQKFERSEKISRQNWEKNNLEQMQSFMPLTSPIPVPPPDYENECMSINDSEKYEKDVVMRQETYVECATVIPIQKEARQMRDNSPRERRPTSMELIMHETPLYDKDTPPPRTLKLTQPPHNRLRVLEILNRVEPQESEPEFVRIGRKLRRSSTSDELLVETLASPPPREEKRMNAVSSCRHPASIPTVSASARVVPSSSMGHLSLTSNHIDDSLVSSQKTFEISTSPPDPDSARFDRPAIFSPQMSPILRPKHPPEASPPPEEPKPLMEFPIKSPVPMQFKSPVEITKTEIIVTGTKGPAPPPPGLLVPKILPLNNDRSGMNEMQNLLNRFNTTRDKKIFEEENKEVPKLSRLNANRFLPTVTGVRTSDGRIYEMPQPLKHTTAPSHPNVVSIAVRDEAPRKLNRSSLPADGGNITDSSTGDGKPSESIKRTAAPPPPVTTEMSYTPTPEPVKPTESVKFESNLDEAIRYIPTVVASYSSSTEGNTIETAKISSTKESPKTEMFSTQPAPIYDYRPSVSTQSMTSSIPRKSLSAQFFENQGVTQKPYGDDVTEIKTDASCHKETDRDMTMFEVESIASEDSSDNLSRNCDTPIQSQIVKNESNKDLNECNFVDKENVIKKTDFSHQNEDTDDVEHMSVHFDVEPDSLESSGDEREEIPNEDAIEAHMRLTQMCDEQESVHSENSSEDENDDDPPIYEFTSMMASTPSIMAGDGNPVRHSLLSLVMEEDIPKLMEAMSEDMIISKVRQFQYVFEFVDLNGNGNQPSTSSILHPPEARKQRRTARKVSRISFDDSHPYVFTYLDERTAERESSWTEGNKVTYAVYQTICDAEQAEYKKNMEEIEKWKAGLVAQGGGRVELEPDEQDFILGVTSRFSYSSQNENSTMSVERYC